MPEYFDLIELAPGVHGVVSDITGPAVGNAAIIDTGDKTLVIDSLQSTTAAAELREQVVRLTGRTAYLVVNTHWHSDHTWGNQVFADAPIASTRRTLELLIADAPADLEAYSAELDTAISALREKAQADDPEARRGAERRLRVMQLFREEAPGFRLTLPDLLFEGRLTLEGPRPVHLISLGGGHTDSDVFAWLPDDRVVIAGDLCWNRIHPRTWDGHPGPWAEILDQIVALAPQRIHPGHGEPGGIEVAEALAPYMRTVTDYVASVQAGGDATLLPPPPGSESWQGLDRMRRGVANLVARHTGSAIA